MMDKIKPIYDVVIVGAGIAGTIAAQTLIDAEITNILVLEARDRCGGRIVTDRTTFNVPIDLGASWIHGTGNEGSGQFIKDLANNLNIQIINETGDLAYYDKNGLIANGDYSRLLAVDIINSLQQFKIDLNIPDSSLETFWKTHIKNLNGTESEKIKALEIARECELWHGTDWDEQSAMYGSVASDGDGDGEAIITGGYDIIYNHVRNKISDHYFRLETYVASVEKTESAELGPFVNIHTDDNRVFTTKHAILTIPIGVLKSNDVRFYPYLPKHIQMAIDCSSLGYLGKVFIEFPRLFWPPETQQFVILANNTQGSPVFVLNLFASTKKPILMLLIPPRLTLKLESNPTTAFEILEEQLSTLNIIQGQPLPKPLIIKNTSWSNDPLTRCSYVAVGTNEDPIANAEAWQRGWDNIRFAGEHTVWKSQGCVQGAWKSGVREAKYIISKLNE